MNIKSIALGTVIALGFVAPAFAGSGASVTNSDSLRVIKNGQSVTKGIIKSFKVEHKRGTSAAIKLESEGSKVNTNSYNSNSNGYNRYYSCYWGCRLTGYNYYNNNYSSNSTNESEGASINVNAGGTGYYGYTRPAGVSGSASGTTVIGATSESSFNSTEVTKSLIGFKDSYQYTGFDKTHTVSTEAF